MTVTVRPYTSKAAQRRELIIDLPFAFIDLVASKYKPGFEPRYDITYRLNIANRLELMVSLP